MAADPPEAGKTDHGSGWQTPRRAMIPTGPRRTAHRRRAATPPQRRQGTSGAGARLAPSDCRARRRRATGDFPVHPAPTPPAHPRHRPGPPSPTRPFRQHIPCPGAFAPRPALARLAAPLTFCYPCRTGWVAERFKAPVLKTGVGSFPPWVRIPPHPPFAADQSVLRLSGHSEVASIEAAPCKKS